MNLPFSTTDFLNVFKIYNQAVFPVQIIFYFFAITSVYLLFYKKKYSDRIITSVLSFLWLWIGVVYHVSFFATINKAAYIFGILFVIQAFLFVHYGILQNKLSYKYENNLFCKIGIFFIIYALLLYPLIGYFTGHKYPYSPTFGLPCPTTIFTFGILLTTNKKLPLLSLIIPLIWSVVGFGGALSLSVYEDYGLLVAGITAFLLLILPVKKFLSYSKKNISVKY